MRWTGDVTIETEWNKHMEPMGVDWLTYHDLSTIMVIWRVQELELHNPKLYWQHVHFHNQNIDPICPLYSHYFSLLVYFPFYPTFFYNYI